MSRALCEERAQFKNINFVVQILRYGWHNDMLMGIREMSRISEEEIKFKNIP